MSADLKKQLRSGAAVAVFAAAFLIGCLLIANSLKGPSAEEVRSDQAQLTDALEWGCEYVGNPLRRVIQAMIREDIRGSARVKPSYFPSIPKPVLHRLIRAQITAKRRRLKAVAPINCADFYPSP